MTAFTSSNAKWSALSCVVLLMGVGFWVFRPELAGSKPAAPVRPQEPEVHYVTPRQLTDSAALATTAVPALTATTDRDQFFTWPRPDDRRPLLLVFIKKGCPCSVELEPFFHRLERSYADVVRVAGVIDADVHSAHRYADANATPYPILADPEQRIIQRFRAENGAYVALLVPHDAPLSGTPEGSVVDSLWPGVSAELFTQMGQRIAASAGVAERPLDVSGLSSAPVTGCSFAQ